MKKQNAQNRSRRRPKKRSARLWLSFLLLLLIGLGALVVHFCLPSGFQRLPNRYRGSIIPFHSSRDRDGDGLDDQTDILQGCLTYLATNPKYESRYYNGGYPNDGYGVCTDVIAFALRAAGYDLRDLVDQDIQKAPKAYGLKQSDRNIDYRRVRNLKVYLARHAIPKSLDLRKTAEWQGGDIVLFKTHIGMVSDRRNERGAPYLLHHGSPLQQGYEQDILEKRDDLIGHYRLSE